LPLEARLLTGLAVAVAAVYWATPLAIRVAARYDFYDRPRGYRGHGRPTPYLGGAALVFGFMAALLLLGSGSGKTVALAGGVVVLWAVGTVDDRRDVHWGLRVAIEAAAGAGLWALGLGWELGLGAVPDVALSALWIVAVVNAFNLFDNMDGQAATMGLVTAIGLATLGVAIGDTWLAVASVALAGACFGFLPHNLLSQPARIFLGDGGSMPLGFAVAALAMVGATDAAGSWQGGLLGLLLVGVPALDTTLVVVSRRRRGLSVLQGGRDHLTHRARQRLRTALAVAVALGSAQMVLSLLAVAASRGSTIVLGTVAIVYLVLVGVAVALIDTRIPADPPPAPVLEPPPSPTPAPPAARRLDWLPREAPLLVLLGAGAGISPLLAGYYGASVWAPLGLGLVVCVLAVGIARPPRPGPAAWLALAGLVGLALWALVSTLWADSIEQAVVEGNRTLTLVAALGLGVMLIRDRRTALWALGSFAATAVVVELVQVVQLLGPDAHRQFLGKRLNEPLGYINAQGTFSIIALWALMAVAEQRRSAVAAGAGLAGVTLCGGLVLLSQSRGAALAVLGSALVVLALAPGRQRRICALLLAFVGVLLAGQELLTVNDAVTLRASDVHPGVIELVAVAVGLGALWGLLVAAERSFDDAQRLTARAAVTGTVVALALGGGTVALIKADAVGRTLDQQYQAFVHLSVAEGGEQTASRLLSGGGNRYDYWSIAVRTWRDNPVLGVGAGNYDQPYFRMRKTTEDIRQPHSLALQSLSELGLPGLALVLLFFGGVGWGVARRRRDALASRTERGLLVAATGMFVAWAIHTQVDWIHLLPGVTGAALIAAAVLLRPRAGEAVKPRSPRTLRAVLAALVVLPVAVAGVSLSRQVLSQHYRGQAEDRLAAGDARGAIDAADHALRLDREDLQAYFTKAAALARLGDAAATQRTLEQAVRVEPGDFLPYALLGDIAVRQRRFALARSYYRRAAELNPREPALAQLAENPRAAAQ
jgi:UDP-GlcNAc:undecaprenyl-phosphate GlcNAc-1-phosphate transferase